MRLPSRNQEHDAWALVRVDWVEKLDVHHLPNAVKNAAVKRQREFWAGRLAAIQCLRQLGAKGLSADAIEIGGDRAPVFPAGFRGSITHDKEFAVAWVALEGHVHGLGVDIELRSRVSAEGRLREKISNEDERKLLRDSGSFADDEALGLALIFSSKESIYKALSSTVGRYFGFDAVSLKGIEPRPQSANIERCCFHFQTEKSIEDRVPLATGLEVECQWDAERVLTHCRFSR
jgi:4'-phosphopantetheinyl transferase EntD